jgi:Uma2 family endonuclease
LVDLPAIAIEFVSEDRRDWFRDYVEKRREYMECGILGYWIIDHFARTMTVVRNHPRGRKERVIREKQTYTTPRLPGFKLPLARLLAVADSWQRPE